MIGHGTGMTGQEMPSCSRWLETGCEGIWKEDGYGVRVLARIYAWETACFGPPSGRPAAPRSASTQSANQLNRPHIQFSPPPSFHLYYTTKMSPEAYNARERRVEKVIETLSAGLSSSVHKCAHHFNISRSTLQDRENEKTSKFIRESINKCLTTTQERAIKNYIIRINKKNILLTLKFIEDVVNYMIYMSLSYELYKQNVFLNAISSLKYDDNHLLQHVEKIRIEHQRWNSIFINWRTSWISTIAR